MSQIDLNVRLQRSPNLVAAEMDGDLVMMSVDQGHYYAVGGVGPRLWELLDKPTNIEALAQALCAEYRVDLDTCRRDLVKFVQNLIDNDIVRFC